MNDLRLPTLRILPALAALLWLAASAAAQDLQPPSVPLMNPEDEEAIDALPQANLPTAVEGAAPVPPNDAGDAIFQFDPETNSIIVITGPETIGSIRTVVDTLDKPIPQALIKVLFLEVTHNNGIDYGVDLTYSGNSTDTNDDGIDDAFRRIGGTAFGLGAETRGGFYRILDDDLQATIRAIGTNAKLEVLSRPSILTRNNQSATITVGSSVPFITNSRVTDTGGVINTIDYEDIGIILEVLPKITANRMVEMFVYPEISTLTAETVPISETVNARVIAKRSAQTNVVVPDGKTVIIGGLMEDNDTNTVTKVPILGDIPILKYLFSRTIKSKNKTELIIFLTPYVVDGPTQLQSVSLAEKNRADLPARSFTQHQYDKYIDNLEGSADWGAVNPPLERQEYMDTLIRDR